jgi:predicted nucleic acid-binding protein
MTRPVVVDSLVLLAFCDPDDPLHVVARDAVAECLTGGLPLVVPASVLSEVLLGAYRTSRHAVRVVQGFVDEIASDVRPLDRAAARAAARCRASYDGLPLHAGLVLGTATSVTADRVLTADPSWAAVDPRVHVLA